jgi:hypothetical protein
MKLGSTGYYYLSGYGLNYDTYSNKAVAAGPEEFAVIFVPETGAIRSIPVSVCLDESGPHFTEIQDVCFDAARHTLFMLYVDYAAQTISVAEYSIEDGGCFGTSAPIDGFDAENWTVQNGILYYLEHTEAGTNYSAVNLDTGEKTVLCENCGWNELVFTGDLYTGYTLYILKRTEGENPETTLYYANTDGTGLAEYWHTDGRYTVYGANGGLVMLGKMEGTLISYGTDANSATVETDAIVSYVLLVGGEAVCLPDQTALRYE